MGKKANEKEKSANDNKLTKQEEMEKELKEASKDYKKMLKDSDEIEKLEEKLAEKKLVDNIKTDENIENDEVRKKDESNKDDNKDKEQENKIDMVKRKKYAIVGIIILLLLIFILIYNTNKKENNNNHSRKTIVQKKVKDKKELTDVQKKIIGYTDQEIIKEKIEEENKTEEYKKYEKLSEEEKSKIEAIPRKEEVPYSEIENIQEEINFDEEEKIPKKFNLANKIKIQVEDQYPFGLCWDFASMKSLETNILLKHSQDLDLSEIHLDYMQSNLFNGYREVHSGGFFSYFEDYSLTTGSVNETDAPYRDYSEYEYVNFPSIPIVVSATNTVNYPSLDELDKKDKNYSEKKQEFFDTVKKHIMTNGSLYTSISGSLLANENKYYNPTTNAQYIDPNDNEVMSDHAVSIVGWDDNYSKNNFTTKPKEDGAWIILNSWGPNYGDKGYYYISYEDKFVNRYISGVVSTSLDKEGYFYLNNIKNEKLKETIKTNVESYIKTNENGEYVPKLAFSKIYYLDLNGMELTDEDLEVIKLFKQVSYLDLSNNYIKDVSALKDNKNLWYLNLSNNKGVKKYEKISVSSLILDSNDIDKLPELDVTDLSLNGNPNIDLSTIPSNIKSLKLSKCELTNLKKLPKLENIISLDLSNNDLNDISEIENIDFSEGYSSLNLSNNDSLDLSRLKNANVVSLDLSNNKNMKNLDSLSNISNLQSLILSNCNLNDTNFLNNMNIVDLDLSDNNITDTTFIRTMPKLSILSLAKNKNLALTGSDTIYHLNLSDCGLSNFDFSLYPKLYSINLDNNIDIDLVYSLSNFSNFESLSIDANGLRINSNDIQSINSENIYISGVTIIEQTNNNPINISDSELLSEYFGNLYDKEHLIIENGVYDSVNNVINVIDSSSDVIISTDYYSIVWNIDSPKIVIKVVTN